MTEDESAPNATPSVTATGWHGEPAWRIRGGGLTATVVPGRGARIASLVDDAGREWLLQPDGELGPRPSRGGDFVAESGMFGWDECAPTIVACTLADGTALPDHGELWALAWQANPVRSAAGEPGLTTSVEGVAQAYALQRSVFATDAGLRVEYAVTAHAGAVPFLWAAHPQFLAPSGSVVRLIPHGARSLEVLLDEPRVVEWRAELDAIDHVEPGRSRKYYLPPDARADRATLVRPDGARLTMGWSSDPVPYVGLWFDRGEYARTDVVAVEPSTGFYDSARVAQEAERLASVVPGELLRWTITLAAGR